MLLNGARARDLMARDGYDGLIAALPRNQYYLSDYWGLFNTAGGYDGSYMALLPRDQKAPAALVVPAMEIRRLESTQGTWMPSVQCYTGPRNAANGRGGGAPYSGWPMAEGAELNELEQRWAAITARLGPDPAAGAAEALARGLREAGLDRARLAADDARVAGWLAAAGVDSARIDYRPQLFNEIRLVKSADEIALMRTAARINEDALIAAARSLTEGATWDEIEAVYMTKMASAGGRGVYLTCGVGGLPGGTARRGEAIMLDGLGQYRQYHGDFGRCAVIGEPDRLQQQRHSALCAGWERAQELLQPGIAYSALSRAVGDAVRKAGIVNFRDPIVHSVGLEHTDDPKPECVPPQTRDEQVLEAGMIINIDLPHIEIGWGAVHMEDTVLVTGDGFERLSHSDFGIIRADGSGSGRTRSTATL